MRPDDRELDEEIRGHLAISVHERIAQGEDPESARLAALRELGYVPAVRESMRRVWYSQWVDAVTDLGQEMRIGLRSLLRTKGVAVTVVVTLALGIGANAAIFSVVRGVLLRPLVNRGEEQLVYIRQSAPGLGAANTTFSVPEIEDLTSRVTTIAAFGDFSTIDLTMIGFGEPRVVQAGIVGGAYFEVMGLRAVVGRLLNAADDRPDAPPAVVLTHRFWTTSANGDPAVIGKSVRLGAQSAVVVGVLEPSLPYPADTEIIANLAASPHHLDATMVKGRTHRMTELFGRLAPGVSLEEARAELASVHGAIMREHPGAYPASADVRLSVTPLRDQITAPARTILLLLLGAAALVFVIACSNVANLILARSVRRQGELAVRAALGASSAALRRVLLAESLVLCGAGALLGSVLARPLVSVVARYASRFSVRALEVTVDSSLLWVGAGLAMAAAVLLAYVPRLPSAQAPAGLGLASGSVRITSATNRRLKMLAGAQIAFSFVLLAGAGTLVAAVVALQTANTGLNMRQVLAFDLPTSSPGIRDGQEMDLYQEATRRIDDLPGVEGVALGSFVPWRDAGLFPRFPFAAEGYSPNGGEERPHARLRIVAPRFFSVVGVPVFSGREFTEDDRAGSERVVIVSESVAVRLFPGGDALNRTLWWTDPLFGAPHPRRIVGIVADVEDEQVVRGPALTIYHPVRQMHAAGRLFVQVTGDPYAFVPAIRRVIRGVSPEQPVERAATLEDIRAEVLAPDRLNAFVLSGFAGVALLIAVVGVSGVLAFSVSARTREFGVRLAVGSSPRQLLQGVLLEGALIVGLGIVVGGASGYAFASMAVSVLEGVRLPDVFATVAAAAVLAGAALIASLAPAARASRVDVLQALKVD
jgi:putative ABC transport system permease protein